MSRKPKNSTRAPKKSPAPQKSESDFQNRVRLGASEAGWMLWRNNRGVAREKADDGRTLRIVRYGLANDSKVIGDKLKSADLIGWAPDGRFASFELKTGNGRIEPGQLEWAKLVTAGGGLAFIVRDGDYLPFPYKGMRKNVAFLAGQADVIRQDAGARTV